jgi:4-hydroxy-tetrahydrodipicolinate reductase
MKQTVIVNGAKGRMGLVTCQTLEEHPEFQLVARLNRGDDLAGTIADTQAQIVIDLTRADCVYENSLTIIHQGAHPIIGTSGLLDAQIQHLRQHCDEKKLGGLIVPNFSIAALLMMRFAAEAARLLPDVEIIEAHHPQKLDAPSGTALKTATLIAANRHRDKHAPPLKELLPGARGANHHGIPIHSQRMLGILARQDVIFGNLGETLTLTHNTLDRSSFMPGLLLACQHVQQLNTLYYGLEHLLT